jgi:hypothetical protein
MTPLRRLQATQPAYTTRQARILRDLAAAFGFCAVPAIVLTVWAALNWVVTHVAIVIR